MHADSACAGAATLIKHLEQQLALAILPAPTSPEGGWIKDGLRAVGLSAAALADRLRCAPASVQEASRREQEGTISIGTLRRYMAALGQEVVIYCRPTRGKAAKMDGAPQQLTNSLGKLRFAMEIEARVARLIEANKRRRDLQNACRDQGEALRMIAEGVLTLLRTAEPGSLTDVHDPSALVLGIEDALALLEREQDRRHEFSIERWDKAAASLEKAIGAVA